MAFGVTIEDVDKGSQTVANAISRFAQALKPAVEAPKEEPKKETPAPSTFNPLWIIGGVGVVLGVALLASGTFSRRVVVVAPAPRRRKSSRRTKSRRTRRNPNWNIKSGDRVTIVNRFSQKSTGRAVMPSSHGGWVLNMGGAHGTPAIADDKNIVSVKKGKRDTWLNPRSSNLAAQEQARFDFLFNKVQRQGDMTRLTPVERRDYERLGRAIEISRRRDWFPPAGSNPRMFGYKMVGNRPRK
jgi:hypothetical protein